MEHGAFRVDLLIDDAVRIANRICISNFHTLLLPEVKVNPTKSRLRIYLCSCCTAVSSSPADCPMDSVHVLQLLQRQPPGTWLRRWRIRKRWRGRRGFRLHWRGRIGRRGGEGGEGGQGGGQGGLLPTGTPWSGVQPQWWAPPGQEGERQSVCGVGQGGGQGAHQPAQSAVHHVYWGRYNCTAVQCSALHSPGVETELSLAMRTFCVAPETEAPRGRLAPSCRAEGGAQPSPAFIWGAFVSSWHHPPYTSTSTIPSTRSTYSPCAHHRSSLTCTIVCNFSLFPFRHLARPPYLCSTVQCSAVQCSTVHTQCIIPLPPASLTSLLTKCIWAAPDRAPLLPADAAPVQI
jgi:hypothetical protein